MLIYLKVMSNDVFSVRMNIEDNQTEIISHHIPCHVILYHIVFYYIILHPYSLIQLYIILCHIISYYIVSHNITSHHIISHHITSHHITSHHSLIQLLSQWSQLWLQWDQSLRINIGNTVCFQQCHVSIFTSNLLFFFHQFRENSLEFRNQIIPNSNVNQIPSL